MSHSRKRSPLKHQFPGEYNSWKAMRRRCTDPRSTNWKYYGGRGVAVCESWRNSFAAFVADVGPKPTPTHTLERLDNATGYEPGNVRWATPKEQQANTSKVVWVQFRGERRALHQLCEEFDRPRNTVTWRIAHGWGVERALAVPSGPSRMSGCRRQNRLRGVQLTLF